MAATHSTSRRAVLGGAAAASFVIVSASHASAYSLEAEFPRLMDLQARVNASGHVSEELIEEWDRRSDAWLRGVQGLPMTIQNAKVRAMAISLLEDNDPQLEELGVLGRLADQITRTLTGNI